MTLLTGIGLGLLLLLLLWGFGEKFLDHYRKAKWSDTHLSEESFNYWMGKRFRRGDTSRFS